MRDKEQVSPVPTAHIGEEVPAAFVSGAKLIEASPRTRIHMPLFSVHLVGTDTGPCFPPAGRTNTG